MNRKLTLIATAFVISVSRVGAAEPAQKKSDQEPKRTSSESATGETIKTQRPDKNSPELRRVYRDAKFLQACATLAADGEMFVADSAQLSKDKEKFAVTFDVVNEANKSTGEFKQLVYAFDGKEATVFFNKKNDKFTRTKPKGGGAQTLKWPPKWWPGSGAGNIGLGCGGSGWGDWYEVTIDNCHFTFISCLGLHAGKMRGEERICNGNPSVKQTRWILIHCACW